MMSQKLCLVITTVKESADADQMARQLVRDQLAACVQIDGPIRSVYQWQDEMCVEEEYRLAIKTSMDCWETLRTELVKIHPYDEPEVILIPIEKQTDGYRDWVLASVRADLKAEGRQ